MTFTSSLREPCLGKTKFHMYQSMRLPELWILASYLCINLSFYWYPDNCPRGKLPPWLGLGFGLGIDYCSEISLIAHRISLIAYFFVNSHHTDVGY